MRDIAEEHWTDSPAILSLVLPLTLMNYIKVEKSLNMPRS